MHGPWQVSYLNPLTGRRHVLVDDIDEATADAVVARFGPDADEFHRLPEVRKELTAEVAA
jgi:hypothetical protein